MDIIPFPRNAAANCRHAVAGARLHDWPAPGTWSQRRAATGYETDHPSDQGDESVYAADSVSIARCDTVTGILCHLACEERSPSSLIGRGRTVAEGGTGGRILEYVYTQSTLRQRAVLLACRRDRSARSGHLPRCSSRLRTLLSGNFCWLGIMHLGSLGVSATLVPQGATQVFELRRIPGTSLTGKHSVAIAERHCNRCLVGKKAVRR